MLSKLSIFSKGVEATHENDVVQRDLACDLSRGAVRYSPCAVASDGGPCVLPTVCFSIGSASLPMIRSTRHARYPDPHRTVRRNGCADLM